MKQPRALTPLFLTEMWERFGFYLIQSLLIFYLTKSLSFSDPAAYATLGEFSAWLYIAPLAGGLLADRILGFRYTILLGAIFLVIGYFMLSFYSREFIYLSLAVIIAGNGLLKPNISSYLGSFYYEHDPRRHAGFTIFYVSINIGGLMATLFANTIQEYFGWMFTFALAAIGMIIAIISFCAGFNSFENRGLPIPRQQLTSTWTRFFSNRLVIAMSILVAIAIIHLLISHLILGNILLVILGVIVFLTIAYLIARYKHQQRYKLLVLFILIIVSILFWAELFQIFSSINLFTDRNVDRTFFGLTIPPATFLSFEPIFIVILGPMLARLWENLHMQRKDPSLVTKFACAMLLLALSMGTLVAAIHLHGIDGRVNALWLILFYFLLTIGEMLLSPIGLAMVTELSPPHLTGLMMGVWFMALGFGGSLSGQLAQLASVSSDKIHNLAITNTTYSYAFTWYAILALIVSAILFIVRPWLNRLLKQHHR